ncbi:MAG TPA: methyltransferase domain-containing protein [Pseudonocardiaceae bacterium]|nr:methyltransferase domain-containing protein [Pseudonocardiaceae bacterium]
MTSLDTIRVAYDGILERYVALIDTMVRHPLDDALIDAFTELAGAAGPIADLGCGPGWLTADLAARGHQVFGIDLSPEMIAYARSTYPDLRFSIGSMTALDLPDGELAGIVSWYSLIHTPPAELPAILAEFHRVSAPGGHVLVGFFSGADLDDQPREFDHKVTLGYRWSAARMAELLAEAGLVEVARMVREPVEGERFPRGYVIARKPALQDSIG